MLIPTIIMAVIAIALLSIGYYKGHGQHISGLSRALKMTVQVLPLLICAFIVAGMVQVLLPKEFLARWVGEGSGIRGIFIGTVAGGLAPGGPYVSLPIAAGLLRSGASVGTMVAFLTGWLLWGINRLPMEIGIMGLNFTLIRIASTFFFPPIAGLIAQTIFARWFLWKGLDMLFERVESEGLAHYSYLIGDGKEAFVIDPRRDCAVYVENASQAGCRIAHIVETHRNEDYAIGSVELAERTDAKIWHADAELEYQYGQPAKNGQTWKIGQFEIEAIFTPGHTPGSMSYLLHDPDGVPWMVFTGDALFAGDVGRVDLPGLGVMEEMANLLYDSLFNKLLKLDDGVIVYPGHGPGSVCGTAIAGRMWTTIGIERRCNPKLQYKDKAEFVARAARELERPPYFRQIEKLNLEGPPVLGALPTPPPLSPKEFAERSRDAIVVDTRMEVGFGASHVPDSISIWLNGLPSFAGWLLPYDRPILLVSDTGTIEQAVRKLIRMGYDNVDGYLAGEMHAWHTAGLESKSTKMVAVQELCHLLDGSEDTWILDVRSEEEVEAAQIPGAHHIHITQLPERKDEVPKDRSVYIFCGSGSRSMIGASLLQREGWEDIAVVLGGLAGWSSITCPVKRE